MNNCVYLRTIGILLCTSLFAGCASKQPVEQVFDDAPPDPIDVSKIPNAVPRAEPLSRYGNMSSYVVYGKRYYTMPSSKGYKERGLASWYGTKFHGKRTSSGEPYDLYSMTAAHKSLPLPTYVEVTNLRNNRSIIVKVNDRGPFHPDRIIDLSYTAAAKLDILGYGTGLVEVRAIDTSGAPDATDWPTWPPPATQSMTTAQAVKPVLSTTRAEPAAAPAQAAIIPDTPQQTAVAATGDTILYLQVGAFQNQDNALRLQKEIREQVTDEVRIVETATASGIFYKVQVGPLNGTQEADRISRSLKPLGINDSRSIVQ